jgi:2-amino-4-hydroxy-6-hydroxymethyldihydropteridine diphosphokinase
MPFENNLNKLDAAVLVALGSNLPGEYASAEALLEAALARFPGRGLRVVQRSSWWRSAAWPNPLDPPFVNGVARVDTEAAPSDVLSILHGIEAEFGRHRHIPNAPRTLDLDLIAYGRVVSDHPSLPHPRAHERAFVMRPLAEIAPQWRHPITGDSALRLAESAVVGRDACIPASL